MREELEEKIRRGKKLNISDFTLFGPGINIDNHFLSQITPFNPEEECGTMCGFPIQE